MSNYLVKWEEQAEVGLLHTYHVAWKKLADAAARKRLEERSKENVKLAVEKSGSKRLQRSRKWSK